MPNPPSPDRFETRVDRLIREAMERGELTDLAGTGKPVPGAGQVDDSLWWVRRWVERNRLRPDPDSRTQGLSEDSNSYS